MAAPKDTENENKDGEEVEQLEKPVFITLRVDENDELDVNYEGHTWWAADYILQAACAYMKVNRPAVRINGKTVTMDGLDDEEL
jgi:hypothetical protein